jgi:hypothetical protein
MNLIDIIKSGLEERGYSGLVIDGLCGCQLSDLSPANCLGCMCKPGYKHSHSKRPEDWIISETKEPVSDDEIEEIIKFC